MRYRGLRAFAFSSPWRAANVFFPQDNHQTALLLAFVIFATGFVMRPLGSLFFGHIGDRYGQKKAIVSSMFLMTLATVAIGLLPIKTHLSGLLLICLIIFRLLQGFAISGENSGSMTFIAEHVPAQTMFFYQGMAISGSLLGFLLGALAGKIAFSFSNTGGIAAWHIPFLFSVVLGIIGLYIRLKLNESPIYQQLIKQCKQLKFPVKKLIADHHRTIFFLMLYILGPQVGFYFSMIFFPSFVHHTYISITHSLDILTITILVMVIAIPIVSWFLPFFNATFLMMLCFSLYVILPIPVFILTKLFTTDFALWGQILLIIPLIISMPLGYPLMTLFFPTEVRFSGVAITTNIVVSLFGGTAPLIAVGLTKLTGLYYAPAIYLSLTSLSSLWVLCYRKKLFLGALSHCFR